VKIVLQGLLAVLVLIQFIPVDIQNPKVDKALEIKAPEQVMEILRRSCYDCHSNEVKIPWYSSIAPFSFSIASHIDIGREYVNFSIWEKYTKDEKDKKLEAIYRTVYAAMPLQSYLWLHKDAKLTQDEIRLIRNWTGKSPF
jgi:hypothetical protein